MAHLDCRNAILLDRGRPAIASELDISKHNWVKSSILESVDGVYAHSTLLGDFNLESRQISEGNGTVYGLRP